MTIDDRERIKKIKLVFTTKSANNCERKRKSRSGEKVREQRKIRTFLKTLLQTNRAVVKNGFTTSAISFFFLS